MGLASAQACSGGRVGPVLVDGDPGDVHDAADALLSSPCQHCGSPRGGRRRRTLDSSDRLKTADDIVGGGRAAGGCGRLWRADPMVSPRGWSCSDGAVGGDVVEGCRRVSWWM